ncbi:MAG TPA: aromatic-ring-hydroxylating dioxygenase subunit beta [Candidatus Binataceae bacterium]|nr:aromatic-ring-hydroxylating dioxygenase subunit beta [Candidatus Binataceae bacterium]
MEHISPLHDRSKTVVDLRHIEQFLADEAHLLDERHFEEWMELFTEDGFYWAPASIDQRDWSNAVSLIYDDRDAMRTRIARLRHPEIHSQIPHSRTARVVANPRIEEISDDGRQYLVRSKFIFYEFRPSIPEALERMFGGTYYHRLIDVGESFKIAWKKAVLANCEANFVPIAIYF